MATAAKATGLLLAPFVQARARILAPAVFGALIFFVAGAGPLGIRASDRVQDLEWLLCAASGLLAYAAITRRVPVRFAYVASTATLWFPMIASILPIYTTGNPIYTLFLVCEIACAGVLLHTAWAAGTLAVALALAIPGLYATGSPYVTAYVATLGSATMFALLTHTLMRRALVREARTALELSRKLDEHARLQEQLVHAQRMEAIGTLAAGIAHDMNNVLASIRSYAELASTDHPSSDLDQIVGQAERGAALTRGLLAFSRRGQYRKRVVRLDAVVREVLPLLARTLPKSLAICDELAFGDACVDADPAHLGQALVNLGVNAADAMDGSGTLLIAGDVVDDVARLRVIDTGKGMDEATRLRAFEPFFTTKPHGRGTGLGLSTVWGIVHAHAGTIEIESAPGHGSTFTIRLPLTQEQPAAAVARAKTGPIAGGRRVLVVEDEPAVRASTRRLLERMGLVVDVACDGAEALRVFEAHRGSFDAVILDMGMPVMGGAECFRRLREHSRVPVLIATGYAVDREMQDLIAAGAEVIEKPYAPDELRRGISRMLSASDN